MTEMETDSKAQTKGRVPKISLRECSGVTWSGLGEPSGRPALGSNPQPQPSPSRPADKDIGLTP